MSITQDIANDALELAQHSREVANETMTRGYCMLAQIDATNAVAAQLAELCHLLRTQR